MWIMTNNAFISIVQHREDSKLVVVRARFPGDLEAFYKDGGEPHPKIDVTPDADYRYRVVDNRERVADLVRVYANSVDYPNFKDSCPHWRHMVYMDVWNIMHRAQSLVAAAGRNWKRRLEQGVSWRTR